MLWLMADETEINITAPVEYRFADGVLAADPEGRMVYLDFLQSDPHAGGARTVARVVIHPALAADLAKQLSKVRGDGG